MTTNSNPLASIYNTLVSFEQAALKSSDANVQAFGAAMSNGITAFRAAVPGLAAVFVNTGIAEAAKAEPIFGLLIPAEGIIDPAVSGFATMFENMLLGAPATPAAVEPQPAPQPQPE